MIEVKLQEALQLLQCAEKTDYIGESVSQLEHALQCAYFAEKSGHSEAVILASLFHDIGHFASHSNQAQMAELGVVNHEWIGAKLAYDAGFSAKVALLIGNHVNAKRYLASKKSNYYERLSEASKKTLEFQGGLMQTNEMNIFEKHLFFKEILQVRINDEKGKELNLDVPQLDYYIPLIKKHFQEYFTTHVKNELMLIDYLDNHWVQQIKNFLELRGIVYA
jgi:putative nucleotidyltransferase with HDIG domain